MCETSELLEAADRSTLSRWHRGRAELQLSAGAVLSDTHRSSPALMWRTDGDLMRLLAELAAYQGGLRQGIRAHSRTCAERATASSCRRSTSSAGGAGDHEAGRPLRRAAQGQRPQHPHDPGGHRDDRFAHRRQREADEDMVNYLLQEFEGDTARSGSPISSGAASTSWSTRICRPSSSGCRTTRAQSSGRRLSASSTRAAAASSASFCENCEERGDTPLFLTFCNQNVSTL